VTLLQSAAICENFPSKYNFQKFAGGIPPGKNPGARRNQAYVHSISSNNI